MDCVQHQQGVGEAERQDGRGDGDVEGPGGDHGEGGGEVPGVLNIICRVKFGYWNWRGGFLRPGNCRGLKESSLGFVLLLLELEDPGVGLPSWVRPSEGDLQFLRQEVGPGALSGGGPAGSLWRTF